MAGNEGGGWGFALPDNGVSPAQALLQGAQFNERRNERRDSLALQRAKDGEESDWRKFQYIKDTTDPSKYLSGQSQIDNHSQSLLGQVMQHALADPDFHTKSLAQIGYELNQKVSNIAQSDLAAKQMYDRSIKQADDAAKKNPNIDVAALKNHAFNEIGNTFLDADGNYRAPDQIDANRDIVGSALNSPDAWKFSLGDAELRKGLQNMQGDERSVFVGSPNTSITTYKGKVTPFQDLSHQPDAHGFVNGTPSLKFKTDKVGGIDVLPSDIENQFLMGDEASRLAYLHAYNNFKQTNGIQTTPQTEDLVRRRFGLQYVKSNVQNDLYPSNIEHLPRYPSISVNTGGSKDININDIYHELNTKADDPRRPHSAVPLNELSATAQGVLLKYANEIAKPKDDMGKSEPYSQADIFVKKNEDGGMTIMHINRENNSFQTIAPIDFRDVNIAANKSVKEKQKVLAETPHQQSAPPPALTNKWAKYRR